MNLTQRKIIEKILTDLKITQAAITKELDVIVWAVKKTEEGVATMCKMMEDMRDEAALAERIEFASKLLCSEDFLYEKIAEYTNLPLEKVQELAKELGA